MNEHWPTTTHIILLSFLIHTFLWTNILWNSLSSFFAHPFPPDSSYAISLNFWRDDQRIDALVTVGPIIFLTSPKKIPHQRHFNNAFVDVDVRFQKNSQHIKYSKFPENLHTSTQQSCPLPPIPQSCTMDSPMPFLCLLSSCPHKANQMAQHCWNCFTLPVYFLSVILQCCKCTQVAPMA